MVKKRFVAVLRSVIFEVLTWVTVLKENDKFKTLQNHNFYWTKNKMMDKMVHLTPQKEHEESNPNWL